MRSRSSMAWCAIDFAGALLLVILAAMGQPPKPTHPSTIPTYGQYAVVMKWKGLADIDLHVVDPKGNDAYFASPATPEMSLEHDFIPSFDVSQRETWQERTIIRQTSPGEYVVNSHFYGGENGPTRVTVILYNMRGTDKEVTKSIFTLEAMGAEHTAFRFTLNVAGAITNINHLQKEIVRGIG